MSHAARLMYKKVAVILVIALVLSALVGPFGLGVASASEDQVSRVEGKNRYETAANIAKAAYPDGNDTVIVARGENVIADALAASVLAGAKNAPILLTKEKSLPPETQQAIEDLGAEQVYILGSEYAISKAVEDALKELVGESNVKRVSGNDRYETAVAVAKEAVSSAEKAYLANGEKTVDALVAGPAAFVNQVPVLLVKQDSIPDVVWEALNDLGVEEIVLVGSVDVISKAVEDALKAEGYDVRRVDGEDRFETSVEFAKSEFPEAASYGIVKGEHDKDAESGVDAVAAVVLGQPLLYATKNGVLNDTVQNFIAERAAANPAVTFTIFGDENAVVTDVENDVKEIIEENAEFRIVSVRAISDTVDQSGTLEFAINNKSEAADLEEIQDAGYTVTFLANGNYLESATGNPANTNNTGKVKATPGTTFKYQVKIFKDGELVAESEIKEVKVIDAANTITAITDIELYVKQNEKEVKVESGTLVNKDDVTVKVLGRTAAMKADEEDVEITGKLDSIAADKVAVIQNINKSDGKVVFGPAKGKVTITAKAGDIEKSIDVNVTDVARQVDATKSSVTPDKLNLATGESGEIVVALKDQYGDTFVPNPEDVKTLIATNAEGKIIAEEVNGTKVEDDLTVILKITADANNAGNGKVVVQYDTTKLAEVALTVTKPGDVVEWKLETEDKKYVIDLKHAQTLQLTLNGYDEAGLLTGETYPRALTFVSSNEDVATVDDNGKVTAKKVGTTVIRVFEKDDAFKETIAEVEITVIDSTPTISVDKVAKVEKVTRAGTEIDLNQVFTITAKDPEGKAVGVQAFTGEEIKDEDGVVIGRFKITTILNDNLNDNLTITGPEGGKITIGKEGEAATGIVNISVLNNDDEFVGEVNIEVEIQ